MGLLLFANWKSLLHVAPPTAFGSLMIGIACMYPFYLWCEGKVKGIPVFPFFALTYLYTFALPLLSEDPNVLKYAPSEHLYAAICTVIFLIAGTVVWYPMVQTEVPSQKANFSLKADKADTFFIHHDGHRCFVEYVHHGRMVGHPRQTIYDCARGCFGVEFFRDFCGCPTLWTWRYFKNEAAAFLYFPSPQIL